MSNGIEDADNKVRAFEQRNFGPPETVRGHLRDAMQALNLLEYEAGDRALPLERIRQEITAALAMCDQVQHEATLHPFSFAQHVAAVL